jgi:hypothetical protein
VLVSLKHLEKIWFAEIDVAKKVQKICEEKGEHLIRLNLRVPDEVIEPEGIGVTVDPDRNASVEGNYNTVSDCQMPDDAGMMTTSKNMADHSAHFYDPTAWFSKWPHDEKPLWDTYSRVHTRFGLAAQSCSELETGLVMLVAQLERALKRTPQLQSLLSALARKGVLPLSPLISIFGRLYGVPEDDPLMEELETARKARNYLIHHFYRDRAQLFETPEGCDQLVEILVSIRDDIDAALQGLKHWGDEHLVYTPPEDTWDRINEDVAKWRDETQQMLDAMLGKNERRG